MLEQIDEVAGKDIVQTHKDHFNLKIAFELKKKLPKFPLET